MTNHPSKSKTVVTAPERKLSSRPGFHFFMTIVMITYVAFCLAVFTPANDLAMLWPYFFLVFTSPLHGLAPGSLQAILVADCVGLAYLVVLFAPLRVVRSFNYIPKPLLAIAAVVLWSAALLLLQFVAWVVAGGLGWPTGI